ncbi:hypothetical protein PENSUB_844 [Penicillium subrubescens]|uniref:Uncharacterized protein n=1 Tax=Penicillium subrubescens TaxID=1316194 RepID=A0A1Q5UMH3_9EURO|nr:hypothetical protein PENSUB_844 [Penicillium subrubescens]
MPKLTSDPLESLEYGVPTDQSQGPEYTGPDALDYVVDSRLERRRELFEK